MKVLVNFTTSNFSMTTKKKPVSKPKQAKSKVRKKPVAKSKKVAPKKTNKKTSTNKKANPKKIVSNPLILNPLQRPLRLIGQIRLKSI